MSLFRGSALASTDSPSASEAAAPPLTVRRGRPAVAPLTEEAFHGIAGLIADGVYEPGERISDKALAEEFGVSRTPVREAMQRLERIGLVEMHPSRYTVVTEISDEMARWTWEFTGLYAGNIVRLALPRLDDDERAEAVRLVHEAIAEVPSATQWLPAQIALFGFLAERAGNELYRSLLGDSWYLILRNLARIGISPENHAESIRALTELADAIGAEDRGAAEQAARRVFGVD